MFYKALFSVQHFSSLHQRPSSQRSEQASDVYEEHYSLQLNRQDQQLHSALATVRHSHWKFPDYSGWYPSTL